MNSNINHGLLGDYDDWRRFTSCNKSTAPEESVGHGEAVHVGDLGVYEKSLDVPSSWLST